MKLKISELRRNYLVPRDLARMLKCSERTARELCKSGKIREARRTSGGQWRISPAFSKQTRAFLQRKVLRDWLSEFNGKEAIGDFEPEHTSSVLWAGLLGKDADTLYNEEIEESPIPPQALAAMDRIDKLITQREGKGEPFWDLQLQGYVMQVWLKEGRCPTVTEVAKMMGISRSEFYRRGLTAKRLQDAYAVTAGELSAP